MNHPNRGKLSRYALELIATFSAGGIALDREQQQAANQLCRAAAAYHRLQVERCNGDWPIRERDQAAWRDMIERQEAAIKERIKGAWEALPTCVYGVVYQSDPRGVTVKLVIGNRYRHLHDDAGGEGLCVPGS